MNQNAVRNIAIFGTITFHTICLVLLVFWGFTTLLPLPIEEGIILEFKSSANFSAPNSTVSPSIANSEPEESKNKYLTQDDEENPYLKEESVEKKRKEKKRKEQDKKRRKQQEEKRIATEKQQKQTNNLIKSAFNSSPNVPHPSDTKIQEENKTGSSKNTSSSKAVSWNLAGRITKHLPRPQYVPNEEGKVIVEIYVNNDGIVIRAEAGKRGTTTPNNQLWKAAENAAMKTKFDPNPKAPSKQIGHIIYNFSFK